MKQVFLAGLLLFSVSVNAQAKRIIDIDAINKWTILEDRVAITNDGEYCYAVIRSNDQQTLIVTSTTGTWQRKISDVSGEKYFTSDSKWIIFSSLNKIHLLELGGDKVKVIDGGRLRYFETEQGDRLIYFKGNSDTLVLDDLVKKTTYCYPGVTGYETSKSGKLVFLSRESEEYICKLSKLELSTGRQIKIYEGEKPKKIIFSEDETIGAICPELQNGFPPVWYFHNGMQRARKVEYVKNLDDEFKLQMVTIDRFDNDGRSLLISVEEKRPPINPEMVRVDVWHYMDEIVQSEQLDRNQSFDSYVGVLHLDTGKFIRLENRGEGLGLGNRSPGHWMVMYPSDYSKIGIDAVFNWSKAYMQGTWLVSTTTGERVFVPGITKGRVSENGKYLYGQDSSEGDFFSYEINGGKIRNMTKLLPIPAFDSAFDYPPAGRLPRMLAIIRWLDDDKWVIATDYYDLWLMDPTGQKRPSSLTNGYGRRNKICFTLVFPEDVSISNEAGSKIVFKSFNTLTKESGFYLYRRERDPQLLSCGAYYYLNTFIKAKKAKKYIVLRNDVSSSTNLFLTTDFRSFKTLTNNYPERKYNWITSELHSFKTTDGKQSQGVLFKPEDLDTTKKYPVIFLYYERLSDHKNEYKPPDGASGEINIPWFVSRGYLVFTPDVWYTVGQPGKSALNTMLGAAKYLRRLSFVDSANMGLQGHSFGGFETNYIIAHTQFFKAACSAAGLSNFVSGYGGLFRGGTPSQVLYEVNQTRIGATLWERTDLYMANSPVLRANFIKTPLLLMHCKKDHAVPFAQSLELYLALRRLGKRCWMLQYDDGYHELRRKDAIDFQLRMTQFFDHYLKGVPAPRWLLNGIPFNMKGIDDGLQLDSAGGTPLAGGLLKEYIPEMSN